MHQQTKSTLNPETSQALQKPVMLLPRW